MPKGSFHKLGLSAMGANGPVQDSATALAGGRYLLSELLASGGMGEVYLAMDTRLHRKVAIKFLKAVANSDTNQRQRFEIEARAAAKVSNDFVATVYDVGEEGDRPYIVMQLLERETLKDRILKGPIAPGEAITISLGILSALGAAHEAGILHRDIKPSNILFDSNGRVKVADFGIATIAESGDDDDRTVTLEIFGTPSYLAPERMLSGRPSAMSDIYSVGAILYEMLSGKRPYVGETPMSIVLASREAKRIPIEELNPKLPRSLVEIVDRALSPEPGLRFQNAQEMASALSLVLSQEDWLVATLEQTPLLEDTLLLSTVGGVADLTQKIGPTTESKAKPWAFLSFGPFRVPKEILYALTAVLLVAVLVVWSTLASNSSSNRVPKITTSTVIQPAVTSTTVVTTTTLPPPTTLPPAPAPARGGKGPPGKKK